jgi:hypothetical protein
MARLSVIERKLLGKSASRCVRTATVLLALQVPMWWSVAHGRGDCTVPMRLSLLVDLGFSAALVAGAVRLMAYFRASRPTPTCRRVGSAAALALALAGVLNVAEGVILWNRFAPPHPYACPSMVVSGLTPLWVLLGLAGGVAMTGAIITARRELTRGVGDPMREAVLRGPAGNGRPAGTKRPGTIIACSGGGIRSASFCLGALQSLMTHGVYGEASAVVGVSGGGYMAAAFHLAGRSLRDGDEPPFAQGTPELALLRRNTRYLLPRGVEIFRGVMSVLYGVAVNIVMIGVSLWGIAWVLGWYLHEYDVLGGPSEHLVFEPLDAWVPDAWVMVALAPWGAAVLGFLLVEKVVDRFLQVGDTWRRGSRWLTKLLLVTGTATALLMLLVPLTLAWLEGNHDNPVAAFFHDLVTPDTETAPGNVGMLAGLVAALGALGRMVATGLGAADSAGGMVSRVVATLRTKIAPWLGSLLILTAAYVALLRLTNNYATLARWREDWGMAVVLLGTVLAVRVLTDVNRTSLHHFYRERLATAYLVERENRRKATARGYRMPLAVSRFAGPDREKPCGPELVMAAVANAVDEEYVPTGRGCVPFIITAGRTGVIGDRSLPPGGTTPTRAYEAYADYDGRDLTLPAAMAISGAALSPLTGRASARTRPVRVLLTVLNARLGVWLPNPYAPPPATIARARLERAALDAGGVAATRGARLRVGLWETAARLVSIGTKPGPYRLLREAFGRPSLYDRRLYVTDGGHYDNLGLLESLRRRPERIYVIDASNDAPGSFGALAEAIATARMDLGVEIEIDVSPLRPVEHGRPAQAWTVGRATYDDAAVVTDIVYLKAQLVPDLTWDVEHYARENKDFPRRSTGDQFYDEWDFEAYRELGSTLADRMIAAVLPAAASPAAAQRPTEPPRAVPPRAAPPAPRRWPVDGAGVLPSGSPRLAP